MQVVPSPKANPNGYVGFSTALSTSFIVTECKRRFGWDVTVEEATVIVSVITGAVLFLGKKVGRA